ncbi:MULTISPECIES: SDR family oxidoreductase [unclassified Mesorhizobium]|uniref:SDR family NAD(P)-dependent oxidoreductase n=1 Tax=unclassified Mesorhizobium TaxID=325217 RepID=UPI0003CED7D5|nr:MULTISPECIES: SDR family oxidoreductase [unclassified Mesorhizobium]ESY51139.1 3-oxoacyl-ACP reductase [Mesorhizobium sp. LNJC374B00]ESY54588.1 3-oxoacyl-ACP reductase [Mesorhizobium sp. LNJC372A00]WJI81938.1 SDR family oxidoreductase [Mesorhizobium sp. C374B]WJI88457.1 SDR family oxidoreductase [Mesorhizobium sp. C372A]
METGRKVVVITGGSQGIGAALVEAYLGRNYRVVATSRSIKSSDSSDLLTISGDIGNPATGPRVIEETLQRFGRVDTLINNAGVFLASSFTHYTAEDYVRAVATNLTGFFFATQAAIAAMERQAGGHVVNITTSLVKQASSKVPSVLASLTKGGADAATRSLAIEYARSGIRVNAVSPGVIRTPMHAPETYERLAALHPLGRLGEISDIVGAVLYLEDAAFVTGETLHVDGGQSAGH